MEELRPSLSSESSSRVEIEPEIDGTDEEDKIAMQMIDELLNCN